MKKIVKKAALGAFIIIFVLILAYISLFFISPPRAEKINYGVTFSKTYAESLDLDWEKSYLSILDDLGVKNIRLPVYWNEIEPKDGEFFFNDYDFLFQEAQKRGVSIVPVIGQKVPRWPECYIPDWLKGADREAQKEETLLMLQKTVEHYKGYLNIKMWQVENEPFLPWFGICPKLEKDFLKKEVDLVRSLDSRPIMITESGELSTWYRASRMGDYLGTTVYRKVFEENLKFYWTYPIPPSFYWARAVLNGKPLDKVIASELQMEPWVKKPPIFSVPLAEQYQTMDPSQFRENLEFIKKTGISEVYLWGAEWWLWLKEKQNDPAIWDEAKNLFQQSEIR